MVPVGAAPETFEADVGFPVHQPEPREGTSAFDKRGEQSHDEAKVVPRVGQQWETQPKEWPAHLGSDPASRLYQQPEATGLRAPNDCRTPSYPL